jgi:probable rRNA maturation factor
LVKNLKVNSLYKNTDKILFHRLILHLKKELDFDLKSLLVNIVSSDYILKINKKFLKHDYSTDIITFNYSKKRLVFDAELYISLQDAEKNAKKYGISLEQELIRLVIHGILHLLGYNDIIGKDKIVMKRMENKLVHKYSFLLLENQAVYGN